MALTRRELRLLQSSPPRQDDILSNPEVLRAVAKKMRDNTPTPNPRMETRNYLLYTTVNEFIKGLEGVATDIERQQQKDENGEERRNSI